jgi:hypothetical protein
LITVARKALEVPKLLAAMADQSLTLSKASRIVSTLNSQNADRWIDFASSHTREALDLELAKENPKTLIKDQMKPVSNDLVEVKITMPRSTFEKLTRAQALEAQRGKNLKWGELMDLALEAYLIKQDPVKKAERALNKKLWPARVKTKARGSMNAQSRSSNNSSFGKKIKDNSSLRPHVTSNIESRDASNVTSSDRSKVTPNITPSVSSKAKPDIISSIKPSTSNKRIPLTAAQKHAVYLRDQGKCTHRDHTGNRCEQDRWLDIHHIVPVSLGGSNDPENLTLLCSHHHDLAHQLSLGIEGQVTWLRSPRVAYSTLVC